MAPGGAGGGGLGGSGGGGLGGSREGGGGLGGGDRHFAGRVHALWRGGSPRQALPPEAGASGGCPGARRVPAEASSQLRGFAIKLDVGVRLRAKPAGRRRCAPLCSHCCQPKMAKLNVPTVKPISAVPTMQQNEQKGAHMPGSPGREVAGGELGGLRQ